MPRPPAREAALLLALLAAVGLLLAARHVYRDHSRTHLAPPVRPPLTEPYFAGPHELNSFVLQFVCQYDTVGQRDAHRVLLLGTAGLAVLLWLAGGWACRLLRWPDWSASAWVIWPLRAGVGAALAWAVWRHLPHLPSWWNVLVTLAFVRWAALASPGLRAKWPNRLLGLLVAIVLVALLLPAAWMKVDHSFRYWMDVETFEAHYTLLLSPGDRLAAGQRLFDDVKPGYGLVVPAFSAAFQKLGGRLTLLDYHKLIGLLQAVFMVAAAALYSKQGGRKWIVAAFPLAFVAVNFHFYQWAVKFGAPNHTALRTLLVPVTFAVLAWVRFRTPTRAAWACGALAGLNGMYCFDIGAALSVALAGFLVLKYPSAGPRQFVPHYFALSWRFAAGLAVVLLLTVGVLFAVCGNLPSVEGLSDFAKTLRVATATGYAGYSATTLPPLAVLMMAHAVVAVLVAFGRRGVGVVGHRTAVSGAAAVALLVWLVYYANHPDKIYLRSGYVLYGVLLVDAVRVAFSPGCRLLMAKVLATVGLCVVAVPAFVAELPDHWELYREGWQIIQQPPAADDMRKIQGVYFPPDARADWLKRKADYLKEKGKAGPVYYLTIDSYLIGKESGVWSATGIGEPLWESVTRANFERLLRPILTRRPAEVYIDAAEGLPEHANPRSDCPYPPRNGTREFFAYLRTRLGEHYRLARTEQGWEVWVPKG